MKIFLRSLFLICCCVLPGIVSAQLTANFTATPVSGCAPLVVQFTSTSTGNPTSYQWNLGNGVNTVQQNPSTTYTLPGTYTVTLTVSNGTSSDTKVVTSFITVHPDPVVDFAANDTDACPPMVAQFINNTNPGVPGPATYNWSFGDGNVSNAANPANTYNVPGSYTVTLVATSSAGCVSTLSKINYIDVFTPPVTNFTANPASYCGTPASIGFTAATTGTGPYTYSWDYGDGNTGVGASPTHTYTNSGVYTVTLIATDGNGCKDTLVKPNYVAVGVLTAGFTTPVTGCENAPFQFTNTSVGGTSYMWYFGDGNTSSLANPAHVYAAGGTYNVKLVAYNSPCADSITIPVTILQGPTANFNFTPNQPCPAPATIQFNNTTAGGLSYAWTFGDGGTSNLANPSHTYSQNLFYEVKLIATAPNGCTDTVSDTVKVHYLGLYLLPLQPKGCTPLPVTFSHLVYYFLPPLNIWQTYPYPVTNWSWTFGDGGTSNLANPTHTYTTNPANVYTATVTATTSNGCVVTQTKVVTVGTKPTASFTDYPDTACVNSQVQFVNTSTGVTAQTGFTWYLGDNNQKSGATSVTHSYTNSGYYNVSLVADNFGCTDTFTVDSAAYVLAPTAKWIEDYNCDTPLMVKFYDTLSIDPTSIVWDFGDGSPTVTTHNPVHTYPSLGTYNVTLYTFNSNYGCSDTLTKTIELVDPILTFTTPDTAICRGDSILFTPNYTHTASLYRWMVNGVTPAWPFPPPSNPNPSAGPWGYRFNTKGIFDIWVWTTDIHGCRDTAKRDDYVLVAKPLAGFSASPRVGCIPLNVTFTDTSSNVPGAFSVTRSWNFGNGTGVVTTASTSQIYPVAGTYNVQLIVTDNVGCSDTLTKAGYIEARQPVAAFSVSDSIACPGDQLQFTNSSTGASLTAVWDFGDGTTSTTFAPVKAYSLPGVYTVKLVVTDPTNCKDSMTKVSYITITKPSAAFTMNDTLAVCPPLTVLFTNGSSNAVSQAWTFGNSSGSSLLNPSTIYSTPGVYPVSLVVTDINGCTDTAIGTVNVLGYAGALDYTPLYGCVPLEVEFKSFILSVPTIIWDFNDGVTIPLNGVDTTKHTYITPGAYVPRLIMSDNAGCTNSSQGLDTIKVDAILPGFITSPPCEKTAITFTDTSFAYFQQPTSWYWNFNNGQQTSTTYNPDVIFADTGTYPVVLVATNAFGCSDTLHTTVTIYPLPVVTAEFDTTICKGDATQLSASGAVSYNWVPITALSCVNCPNPQASPVITTNYIAYGTDFRGCVNKDSVLVTVKYVTTSEVGPGGGICEDSSFQLMAMGAERYEWSPAASLNDYEIPNPIASPTTTTTYTVLAWEASCLPDTNQVTVAVYPKPVVDAGKDVTIIAGTSTVLLASSSNFETYTWSPAATLSCENCANPVATPVGTTVYVVTARSDRGCKAFDSVTVHILCDDNQVFIPNTFTPNSDGQNDVFYPRGSGLRIVNTLRVYNRWGEVVFERNGFQLNDMLSGWDGTYKGKELTPDIFIYSIEGICDNGDPLSWKGDITLMR